MPSSKQLRLYERKGSYVPRVAAVHDLCGYGKCSLGVAIPVLSAAGCDVCAVPTSLFSAHTKFPHFYVHDTTEMLDAYLDAWNVHGVELDAVYSGFLGSAAQVEVILRLWREHPQALRVVDPVMGDEGAKYPTYTDELCQSMARLVQGADLLTPNLTEAAILTGTPYEGQDVSDERARFLLEELRGMGAKNVVLKGVSRGDGLIRNFLCGEDGSIEELSGEQLPFMLHGTGDLYASGLLAAVMAGRSLYESVDFAGRLVHDSMVVTRRQPDFEMRGVSFESKLKEVTDLLG
ncbi:PfkB family carbohydrate kinase [Olsenella urininfantis]|uniref:PfkB family carbohydrate kinase n=1 Tax=Olsenella urininfantis TaxID=1871033 RepID=UPI000985564A|nr:PfkB family carbohydrate kinase [Olsenella urininfantis]